MMLSLSPEGGEGRVRGFMEKLRSFAKNLRRNQTDAERQLWLRLRNRQIEGFKFRRQHQVGPFIVDFVCVEQKLVVEVDGSQHMERIAEDDERTAFLQTAGFRLIRFWNDDVLRGTDAVLTVIRDALLNPSPQPSPLEKGRG